jgi:hypothetical protein
LKALEEREIALICLTSENLASSWLQFETGAIAASMDRKRVIPYLINLDRSQLANSPMEMFQFRDASRDGTWEILREIAGWKGREFDVRDLEARFEQGWPELERAISSSVEAYFESRKYAREVTGLLEAVEQSIEGPDKRIYFLGSFRSVKFGSIPEYNEFAKTLGSVAAEKGFRILVGSTPRHTLDHWVVIGANQYSLNTRTPVRVDYHYPVSHPAHPEELFFDTPRSSKLHISQIDYPHARDASWRDTRFASLLAANAVILLGGKTSLQDVDEILTLLKKDKKRETRIPLMVPIPAFGGSARELYLRNKDHYRGRLGEALEALNGLYALEEDTSGSNGVDASALAEE